MRANVIGLRRRGSEVRILSGAPNLTGFTASINLDRVTSRQNVPDNINVIIEIPAHSDLVKHEIDKETGAMFVDRFNAAPVKPRF